MSALNDTKAIEAAFLARHGVREMKNSHANIMRLLRSSGASLTDAHRVKAILGRWGARYGAFDHGRLFGRDRRPTLLVGHPYGLGDEDLAMIAEIRALGLVVQVNGPPASFYNTTTCQVLVFAGPAIAPDQGDPYAASSPHHTHHMNHDLANSNFGANPPPH